MIILNIPENDIILHDDEEIVSLIYEVSKTETFDEILVTSGVIPYRSLTHIFNTAVSEGERYYGRAAIISDKRGLFTYTRVSVDTAEADERYEPSVEPPKLRQPPKIYFDFLNDEIPNTCFRIHIEDVGEAERTGLVATTWLIRDIATDDVVLFSDRDTDNLFEYFVSDFLEQRSVFVVSAMFHFANEDNSLFASEVIYIPKSELTYFIPKDANGEVTGTYNTDTEVHVEIEIPANASNGLIEIIKDGEVVESVEDTEYHDDDAEYDSMGMIQVRVKSDAGGEQWTYRTFVKYGDYNLATTENEGFVYNIPGELG